MIEQSIKAVCENDLRRFRQLLQDHPELKGRLNDPTAAFDSPMVTLARSKEMLDLLLEAGADLNARSRWWAGGFGLLDSAEPALAAYAIERGAVVDVHAAARLGLMDRLRELIAIRPELVHARGGDGQTPLHFASTIEVAAYLLDHKAEIDALDIDHESTPAQYMVRDRQPVLRYLVQRGCKTDILMASALGDAELVRKHLDADLNCIRMRVDDQYFPKKNHRSGGTIYQWTLGWHVSAHQVARQFGHEEVLRLLMERSPADVRLLAACWMGDERAVQDILQSQPASTASLIQAWSHQIAHAARNNNLPAVRLMLAAGLPVAAKGQHGGTPLHWAAFHGNAQMAQEILRYQPPLEQRDADFHSTPVGWAVHGSVNGWYAKTGDYAATIKALLEAGAKPPEKPGGSDAVKEVLTRFQARG